jgi:hypothetical protein
MDFHEDLILHLVDGSILAVLGANLPPIPRHIAAPIARTLFSELSAELLESRISEIEAIVTSYLFAIVAIEGGTVQA